jgi:hypothetical protein
VCNDLLACMGGPPWPPLSGMHLLAQKGRPRRAARTCEPLIGGDACLC